MRNLTITLGGTAQDLFAANHSVGGFIINALTENMWLNFGATAAVDAGELIYKDSPAKFSYSEFPELNARISIFSATTGAKFTLRYIS